MMIATLMLLGSGLAFGAMMLRRRQRLQKSQAQ